MRDVQTDGMTYQTEPDQEVEVGRDVGGGDMLHGISSVAGMDKKGGNAGYWMILRRVSFYYCWFWILPLSFFFGLFGRETYAHTDGTENTDTRQFGSVLVGDEAVVDGFQTTTNGQSTDAKIEHGNGEGGREQNVIVYRRIYETRKSFLKKKDEKQSRNLETEAEPTGSSSSASWSTGEESSVDRSRGRERERTGSDIWENYA